MGLSHSMVVNKYFSNIKENVLQGKKDYVKSYKGCNVFNEGDTLYSYGTHFELAVVGVGCVVLNGDRRSVSTSKHQSLVRGGAIGLPHCLIPFSALHSAGINPAEIKIVDKTEDQYRDVTYKDPETGEQKTRQEHLLGSTLFTRKNAYYLSSTDPTGHWGRNYFLTKLVIETLPPKTVAEAYQMLKPKLVIEVEKAGIEPKRQGEWFFIPLKFSLVVVGKRGLPLQKQYELPSMPGHSNGHLVRDVVIVDERILCRGTVRHQGASYIRHVWKNDKEELITRRLPGDHKMLKLGNVWHEAVRNIQEQSWSGSGGVD